MHDVKIKRAQEVQNEIFRFLKSGNFTKGFLIKDLRVRTRDVGREGFTANKVFQSHEVAIAFEVLCGNTIDD